MDIVIAGAGIGGLSLALSLHNNRIGDSITLLEAAPEIRPLGVGVNLPPHATRELFELGLQPALAAVGIETSHLTYYDPSGRELWAEVRGRDAGYDWPQYSIHRGALQMILRDACLQRLGPDAIRTGCRVTGVTPEPTSTEVIYQQDGRARRLSADLLVGADGIRSAVRDSLRRQPTELAWNGWIMYRGTTVADPFLDGRTMVIVGDETLRVVVYPIERHPDGRVTLNWILSCKGSADSGVDFGNWNRPSDPGALAAMVDGWTFDWLDIHGLIGSAREAYEYPMVDFEPLDRWTYRRATLLGDAAHAMYPFGSNGASQSILDARFLARELALHGIDVALATYETARIPVTAAVQQANRRQADETMRRVSDLARARAGDAAREELQNHERKYKRLAGFDRDELNNRESWSVVRSSRSA